MTPHESPMSSTTLSLIAIGVSLLSVISSVVIGGLALRRAKRGPEPRARWELTRPMRRVVTASGPREEQGWHVLQNAGNAEALNVHLDWVVAPTRYDGPVVWERVGAGAKFRLPIVVSHGSPLPVIRLRWSDAHGSDQEWVSDLLP
jgi:hypothetical protein